jgi:hypothetical protein
MDSIWTYGNNNWNTNFKLTKLELITVFTSITLWKKFYPTSKTHLYCDESVKQYLTDVDLIHFWDIVDTSFLQNQDVYQRSAFWTIDKIRLFQHIKTPFTFMDFDFYIKKPLPEYTDYDYVCCFAENTLNYYPNYNCSEFQSLDFPKEFTFKDTAHNTCFFYVSNSDVTKQYTDMCLSYMKLINHINGINGGHSVFLEQTLLYELALVNKWKTKTLIDTKFNDFEWKMGTEKVDGFLSPKESDEYFRHLSNDKRNLDEGSSDWLKIQSEIIYLTKTHNPQLLQLLFKLIKDESYSRKLD